MMGFKIEICSNSVQSAVNAQTAGADRVELCDNLWESGTTPGPGSLKMARHKLSIGLFVLIRPRGGDFFYSDLELEIMKEDIRAAKNLGADGIVSGVLNENLTIDIDRTVQLVELTHPLPFTFHRAFDVIEDMRSGLNDLINCGATRVLTSGGKTSAIEGSGVISDLVSQAEGRITILPGGGITAENIRDLIGTGCQEFHFTGSERFNSPVKENPDLKLNGSADIPENDYMVSSVEKIKKAIQSLAE